MIQRSTLRRVAALLIVAGAAFLLYTFYAISHVPAGDGSGFQWLRVIPLGGAFIVFFLPALLLVAIGRLLWIAAALAIAGLTALGVIWVQLLAEFPKF